MTDRDVQSRGVQLLWGSAARPPRGPKPTLSLQRIVDGAVELADSEGLEALSMQRLAAELGAGTMSLYRYVPSKDDLISLMLDAAIGAPPEIGERTGWRSAMETWARANVSVFERHPWALTLVTKPRVMGPNEVAYLEAGLAALRGTGLDHAEMLNTVLLVNGFVRGSAPFRPERAPGRSKMVSLELLAEHGQQERFPTVAEVLSAMAEHRPRESDAPFEYGLRRVLDGIAARIESL
ncbi:TetR/AcrR family transcriptional regulator [Saccharopolyspora rhizosphaerae]|uniref:TetR/AcrR family transcriptional regulator n=1 Tax=Saccharopolyspora rhizosphaerae TaxID=2492662 RepID=A0A3R8Q712_9PSEU|nr:TetR/AcrR family transcriptional regulator [Saccharopolyspora rhizosphaerae]RRO19872.1 TetR/AcrR family transcriptional regulator [Saccharopolyspora rhizosphaerae]